jgi:hypothetical protein
VAYGSVDPFPGPDTLQDAAPVARSTTTDKDPKRTTFSHATGEAKVPFHWKQLRTHPRVALVAAAALTTTLIVWLAVRSKLAPSESAPGPGRVPAAAHTPTILPLTAPPPAFVGPPLPPPEELARAQAAAYARANARNAKALLDQPDHLPNPFGDGPEVEPGQRRRHTPPASAPPQSPAPQAPPAEVAPPRPKRQLIKEL